MGTQILTTDAAIQLQHKFQLSPEKGELLVQSMDQELVKLGVFQTIPAKYVAFLSSVHGFFILSSR